MAPFGGEGKGEQERGLEGLGGMYGEGMMLQRLSRCRRVQLYKQDLVKSISIPG